MSNCLLIKLRVLVHVAQMHSCSPMPLIYLMSLHSAKINSNGEQGIDQYRCSKQLYNKYGEWEVQIAQVCHHLHRFHWGWITLHWMNELHKGCRRCQGIFPNSSRYKLFQVNAKQVQLATENSIPKIASSANFEGQLIGNMKSYCVKDMPKHFLDHCFVKVNNDLICCWPSNLHVSLQKCEHNG